MYVGLYPTCVGLYPTYTRAVVMMNCDTGKLPGEGLDFEDYGAGFVINIILDVIAQL